MMGIVEEFLETQNYQVEGGDDFKLPDDFEYDEDQED